MAALKLDRLIVTFTRRGHEIEREEASSGVRALKLGLVMLARLDDLQAGDRLEVHQDVDGTPLPPPRRGGGQ